MPRDTCQSYMWVVANFLQTDFYEISIIYIYIYIYIERERERDRGVL
jgi:hypothetical protein